MLEDASRAQRTKITRRRKEELRKLGVKYDFKGDFLKQITDKQLEGLGLLGDQARGSTSPEADLISRAKSRHVRALDRGYSSHLPKMDRTRAQVKSGVSESSQLEHMATCLVYLDVHDQTDVPNRVHYIG